VKCSFYGNISGRSVWISNELSGEGEPAEHRSEWPVDDPRSEVSVDGKDPGTATHWQLTGSYKAANGNYGEFQLNETGTTGRAASSTSPPAAAGSSASPYELKNGDRLLFIGNSFMANEGGVFNYLAAALQKNRVQISVDKQINYGKPLREMMKPEVRAAIEKGDADAVVITSGQLAIMKQFDGGIRQAGMNTVVFMT
jgi:hypothetical protein